MSVINTNVSSLQSQNSLHLNESKLSSAMQRLSTGVRINSAKDDAAGLAITTRMTSEIRGLTQAVRNANDGISVAQTAEGSLGEITNILQRLRELAVQSANASNNNTDRSFLNTEAQQLIQETQRIGTQSSFNGVKLLDGTFTGRKFQVGANAGEVIDFNSIASAKTDNLGSHVLTSAGSVQNTVVTGATNGLDGSTFQITTAGGGVSSNITYVGNASAKDVADAINSAASGVGVSAAATNTTTLSAVSHSGNVTFTLNGQAIAATVTTTDLSSLAAAINAKTSQTSVTASFTGSSRASMVLTSNDGSNIKLENYANDGDGAASVSFGGTALTEGGTVTAVKTGQVKITSSQGRMDLTGANLEMFQSATQTSTLSSVGLVDISTQDGAIAALSVVDSALTQVNNTRAALGGLMNRFEATVSNQNTTIANLSASRSRILDTDYAVETTNLAKAQIIQQAATAMLAQANQSSQSVLALLK